MKQKRTLFIFIALMTLIITQKANAAAADETTLAAAAAQIVTGGTYHISTDIGGTTYYLTTGGTLSSTSSDAGSFVLTVGNTTSGEYALSVWYITHGSTHFTNPTCKDNSPTSPEEGTQLKTSTSSRIWESQVLFYDSETKLFAVRSTNAPASGNWGANTFWNVSGTNACYDTNLDTPHFIWKFTQILSFDRTVTYKVIANSLTSSTTTYYVKSPKYNTSSETSLVFTSDATQAAKVMITSTSGGNFYLYDVVSGYFISQATDNTSGTAWNFDGTGGEMTISKTTDYTANISGETVYLIQGANAGYMSAVDASSNIQNAALSESGAWLLQSTGESTTSDIYADPTAVYYLKNSNTISNCYFKSTAGNENSIERTSSTSDASKFVVIPVNGVSGSYYLYDMTGKQFVTPPANTTSGSLWTYSTTTPSAIVITNDVKNTSFGSWYENEPIYLIGGTINANAYNGDNTTPKDNIVNKVATYTSSTDRGSHWKLVRVKGEIANIDLSSVTSAATLIASAATNSISSTYSKTVAANGYSTLIVPFEISSLNGLTAYQLTSVDGSKVMGSSLSSISANKPVLLKNTTSSAITISGNGVPSTYTSLTDGELTGAYDATSITSGYVLQNQTTDGWGFYTVKSAITVPAFRAYLKTTTGNAKALSFSWDEEATAIRGVDEADSVKAEYYTLSGTRLSSPLHGVNIVKVNGKTKKVVIK